MAEQTDKTTEPTPRYMSMSTTTRNVLLGVGVVVLLAVAFYAGWAAHDNRQARVRFGNFAAGPGSAGGGGRGFGTGGGFYGGNQTQNNVLSGKVSAVNGNDFTLDQNGSTKTIKTDSDTRFRGVGISGIKTGDQVVVTGTLNSDGSIQAVSVSVGNATTSSAPDTSAPVDTQSF